MSVFPYLKLAKTTSSSCIHGCVQIPLLFKINIKTKRQFETVEVELKYVTHYVTHSNRRGLASDSGSNFVGQLFGSERDVLARLRVSAVFSLPGALTLRRILLGGAGHAAQVLPEQVEGAPGRVRVAEQVRVLVVVHGAHELLGRLALRLRDLQR